MSVAMRLHARRRYVGRRLGRRAAAILGGVVLTVTSTISMFIAFIPAAMFMGMSGSGPATDADWEIMGRLGRAWLVAVAITISGSIAGTALLRSRRGMVLWLRRFRNQRATAELEAALDHIGRTWRVVTLSDSMAEPMGVAAPLRISTRVARWFGAFGDRAGPAMKWLAKALMRVSIAGAIASVAWSVYRGRFFDLLGSFPTFEATDPLEARLLTGFVAVLVLEFVVLLAWIIVMLGVLLLTGLWTLTSNVGQQLRDAEAAKHQTITTVSKAHEVAAAVATTSDRVFAPRLTVLSVDDLVWRETVSAFAERADAVLIDVSEVTDNLVWEVAEVGRMADTRPVFIADSETLDRARLVAAIGDCDVLAYTTGLFGRRRFERALFGELESTLPPFRMDGPHLRNIARVWLGLGCFGFAGWLGIDMISSLF